MECVPKNSEDMSESATCKEKAEVLEQTLYQPSALKVTSDPSVTPLIFTL